MGATASLLNASDIQARVTKELVSGIFAKHNTPFSEELYQDLSEFANELELLTSNLSEIEQSVKINDHTLLFFLLIASIVQQPTYLMSLCLFLH